MHLTRNIYLMTVVLAVILECVQETLSQEATFELPVQLVGFPFIIMAVKLTNFVKRLGYSLSPATYRSARARREIRTLDVSAAEKSLVAELGEDVCVYTRVCSHYAERARARGSKSEDLIDWPTVLRQYKKSPDKNKEYYLLSVFLGDIVASPQLCHQLAKRRPCGPDGLDWSR